MYKKRSSAENSLCPFFSSQPQKWQGKQEPPNCILKPTSCTAKRADKLDVVSVFPKFTVT